jgi:hypothetical protein
MHFLSIQNGKCVILNGANCEVLGQTLWDFLTTDVYGDILNRNKKCLHVHMVGVKVLNSCDHL